MEYNVTGYTEKEIEDLTKALLSKGIIATFISGYNKEILVTNEED